jgi:predicted dienelactone hydrolase
VTRAAAPIVVFAGLLGACGEPGPKPDTAAASCEVVPPETAWGAAPSGYRVLDAPVDAPWLAEPRAVPVGVWYPTADTDGDAALYIDTFPDPDSWVDAAFADPAPGCALPLVVYSHGSQAWGGNTSPILRQLVRQGWVAAAPDHVGNTLADNVDPRPVSYSRTRVADIVATLDALEALPEGDPLHGRIDTSRVLVLGHSFGGQTAWLLAGPTFDTAAIDARCDAGPPGCSDAERAAYDAPATDPRVVAVMPLDGFANSDLVATDGWATADRPILYLSQAGDDTAFQTAAAADLTWGSFEGSCHETFTNSPVSCSTFDKQEGIEATATFLTAFAATEVLERDDAAYTGILDGSTVVDSRVTLQRTGE